MAFKMFSAGLVLSFVGMCLCQQQPAGVSSPKYPSAAPQTSFQTASTAAQQPQIKLEDIERDSLAAAFGQKVQQQSGKPSASNPAVSAQQQQSYQSAVDQQQQYFVQPYQAQQQQFYVQPYHAQQQQQYLAQPQYQMAFDYAGVQYMIVNPNAYQAGNQIYQPYYVPAAPQPSATLQYVTKQSATGAPASQEYKQQFAASAQAQQLNKQQSGAPVQAQQEYKQQFEVSAQAQQEQRPQFTAPVQVQQQYKQQYVLPSPVYQYVQQPAAASGPIDFSYVTRHPAPAAQFKAPAAALDQQQFQYTAVPQQYQQPQYYFPSAAAAAAATAAAEQPRVQVSSKSQFSSGVKSTTPFPLKESFAYKFESSPPSQQQPGAAYSTIKYSA